MEFGPVEVKFKASTSFLAIRYGKVTSVTYSNKMYLLQKERSESSHRLYITQVKNHYFLRIYMKNSSIHNNKTPKSDDIRVPLTNLCVRKFSI